MAPEPLQVSFPKLIVFVPAGFMLGAMVGVGLAFAVELLNDLVRTPSDLRKYLGIPLLGMIYHSDEDENIDQIDLCHVVRQAPYSIMSECYRQLRTNIRIKTSDRSDNVFLVTSCGTLDGKTSVAVNLSNTFIAEDMNVLLIDTNFRKPSTSSLFPVAHFDEDVSGHSDFGLSNYLMGQCQYEQVIRNSGIENLDIIDSGPLPANPAEILGNVRMSELIFKTKGGYDYVIVDGPPMLVSETKILATNVDGVIFVLNSELTHRGAAQRVIRDLKNINVNILGGVLLGVRALKGGYFHEIFNSYQQYQNMQVHQPI
jgi:capsular exopolysaccharide synthesis family protein